MFLASNSTDQEICVAFALWVRTLSNGKGSVIILADTSNTQPLIPCLTELMKQEGAGFYHAAEGVIYEANAGTGEGTKGNVRGRAGETDEAKHVQGSIEIKEV